MIKTKQSVGMLLTAALIYGCGSDSKSSNPTSNDAGNGGSVASGGATGGGGTDTGGSSGTGGEATGGEAGAGGAVGVAPINDHCVTRAVKHADGLCYCQPSTLTMCSDACANFQTDPDHCGDCDTACDATEPCNDGNCGAAATAVVPAATGCGSIYLALGGDGTLYWTDAMHGTVKSLASGGTTPASVADNQMAPTFIQVNGTSIYWLASGTNSIMKASTTSAAAPQSVVTSATAIAGFTLSADGNTLYFSTQTIINMTSTTPGGAVTEVGHEDTGIPRGLAVEGNLIGYPADHNGDVDIMTMVQGTPAVCASEDSTTATNLNCARAGRSQGDLDFNDIRIIDGKIYWANQAQILSSSATAPTGVNDTIATGNSSAFKMAGFAINNGTVYYIDDKGFVYMAPLMLNAKGTLLARAQLGVTSVVANNTTVYWANGECAIMSLPAN